MGKGGFPKGGMGKGKFGGGSPDPPPAVDPAPAVEVVAAE